MTQNVLQYTLGANLPFLVNFCAKFTAVHIDLYFSMHTAVHVGKFTAVNAQKSHAYHSTHLKLLMCTALHNENFDLKKAQKEMQLVPMHLKNDKTKQS